MAPSTESALKRQRQPCAKSEIRISKSETNSNAKIPMTKTSAALSFPRSAFVVLHISQKVASARACDSQDRCCRDSLGTADFLATVSRASAVVREDLAFEIRWNSRNGCAGRGDKVDAKKWKDGRCDGDDGSANSRTGAWRHRGQRS